ncbi:hypothetical protein [Streptomyces sp. bgisy060]|uniref:hypothetical protein n=1 Tax=Streptomyces sp. bgisy060 TaxID=3413775 RepID=UPI003EB790B2
MGKENPLRPGIAYANAPGWSERDRNYLDEELVKYVRDSCLHARDNSLPVGTGGRRGDRPGAADPSDHLANAAARHVATALGCTGAGLVEGVPAEVSRS